MKRLLLAALAATALSAPALAGGLQLNCHSAHFYGQSTTRCALETIPEPHRLTGDEIAEQEHAEAKWLAFCKPTKETDNEGMVRLRYAQKGCEFGRSE